MGWYLGSMHVPGLAWIVEECLLAVQLESLKFLQLWASKLGVKRRTVFRESLGPRSWSIQRRPPAQKGGHLALVSFAAAHNE